MTNDTPYLLRMEALKLANARAEQKFQMEWSKAAHNSSVKNEVLTEVPSYPTTEEILLEATKLKDFVNTK
jgi:hypothetical protein